MYAADDGSRYGGGGGYSSQSASPYVAASAPLGFGTSALLRERIRAQEANLRALRAHSPLQRSAAAEPVDQPHMRGGVLIPPLRLPTHLAPSSAIASAKGGSPSSSRSVALPQSNESATYFAGGGELALIMRVRLDSGVHSLEVPYGVHSQSLAQAFGNRHALKPPQVHLLAMAISSHLDLLEQYQSTAPSTYRSAHGHESPNPPPPAAEDENGRGAAANEDDLAATQQQQQYTDPSESPAASTAVEVGSSTTPPVGLQPVDLSSDDGDYHDDDDSRFGADDSFNDPIGSPSRPRRGVHAGELARRRGKSMELAAASPSRRGSTFPFSPKHADVIAALPPIPSYTPQFSPMRLPSKSPSRHAASSPSAAPHAPYRGATGGPAWKMISNVTPSARDVRRGMKGAPEPSEEEKKAEAKRAAERRRLTRQRAKGPPGATTGSRSVSRGGSGTTTPRAGSSSTAEGRLERARSHASFLASQQYKAGLGIQPVPFLSPKSQQLAAKRASLAETHASALASALERGDHEEHARLLASGNDGNTVKRKREALRKRVAEEEQAQAQLFKVTGRSKQLIEETRGNSSSDAGRARSAALRMYAEGNLRESSRSSKATQLAEQMRLERGADDAANCTFKPVINELAQSVVNTTPIWAREPSGHTSTKARAVEREKKRREEEEQKQLTFTPAINPVSLEIALAKRALSASAELTPSQTQLLFDGQQALLRSRSASRGGSQAGSTAVSPSRYSTRGRSTSPARVALGAAASIRLHSEASTRRARQAQAQAASDELVQPFFPNTNTESRDLGPPSTRERVASSRRHLKTLDLMAAEMAAQGDAYEAAEIAQERRRVERVHNDQLKQIHASFLARASDFATRKEQTLARISSLFHNGKGNYVYDPVTHHYAFQPFFKPRLVSKMPPPPTYDPQAVYTQSIGQVKPLAPNHPGSGDEKEAGRPPAVHLSGPAMYSGSAGKLVSHGSSSMLAKRETQRIHLLFMLLDGAGIGRIDASCATLIDDIPSPLDRKIVQAVFDRMARASSPGPAGKKHTRSVSSGSTLLPPDFGSPSSSPYGEPLSPISAGGVTHARGSLVLPSPGSQWSMTLEAFSAAFAKEYKLEVQREGPQASHTVRSRRGSAATSRSGSGAVTPRPNGATNGASATRDGSTERRTSFLLSNTGLGGKGHSRRGSLAVDVSLSSTGDTSASPRSGGSATSSVQHRRASSSSPRFLAVDLGPGSGGSENEPDQFTHKPYVSPRSAALAAKNHESMMAAAAALAASGHQLPKPDAREPSPATVKRLRERAASFSAPQRPSTATAHATSASMESPLTGLARGFVVHEEVERTEW